MKNLFSTLIPATLLMSCALIDGDYPTQEVVFVFDSVKFIKPGIKDLSSSSTFMQDDFEIQEKSRLLLRYEKLADHRDSIVLPIPTSINPIGAESSATANPNPDPSPSPSTLPPTVKVEVTVYGLVEKAADTLRLCPITSPWMMLASWTHSSPLSRWKNPGSDLDHESCVTATHHVDQKIYFDMTQWAQDYFVGRNSNDGLVLISVSDSVTVIGDRSGNFAPRIYFRERIPVDLIPIQIED